MQASEKTSFLLILIPYHFAPDFVVGGLLGVLSLADAKQVIDSRMAMVFAFILLLSDYDWLKVSIYYSRFKLRSCEENVTITLQMQEMLHSQFPD